MKLTDYANSIINEIKEDATNHRRYYKEKQGLILEKTSIFNRSISLDYYNCLSVFEVSEGKYSWSRAFIEDSVEFKDISFADKEGIVFNFPEIFPLFRNQSERLNIIFLYKLEKYISYLSDDLNIFPKDVTPEYISKHFPNAYSLINDLEDKEENDRVKKLINMKKLLGSQMWG